jgi:hypothetical protein
MKNNKGYYHWIHSLNQASQQVQYNNAKLLHEAMYNPTVSGETGLKTGRTRIHGSSRASLGGLGGMIPTGGVGFGGEEYEDLGDTPAGPGDPLTQNQLAQIHRMSAKRRAKAPHRTAKAEDAGASAARHAAETAETTRNLFASAANVSPKFRSPIGAQARIEAGHGVPGDVELAAHDLQPTQVDLDDNGIVGDAGDVALDASDNSMDRKSPVAQDSREKAYRDAALAVARKGGSRDEMRTAGRNAWRATMTAPGAPTQQTTPVATTGDSGVLRGRAAQLALAQKKGKRLSESVSNIIDRMLNG